MSDGARDFLERAERLAAAFRTRYGVDDDGAWTDPQIDQALADAGLPELATLPGEPRGMMARQFPGPLSPGEDRAWRRVNAMHLLGHVMAHGGARCGGCADW
jgi:hypothetical protein